ncbi:hypothetical protein L930_00825, partial [Helicobacter pylori PZ5004]
SKAQAKMLEMRSLKPDPQAHLSTLKKAEKAGYGYSKRM